ncbi:MAG: hypothetical protein H0U74_01580 [Bradymonadaceae bacterium]|nr:hypothetical protein [Lujinxingiaceae bacterium]
MSAILFAIIGFFVQALALKVALGVLGQPSAQNKYSTALSVAALLNFSGLLLGFVPFFGWFIYAILWLAVVMGVYHIGFVRGLAVAVLQIVVKIAIGLILSIFGLKLSGMSVFGM